MPPGNFVTLILITQSSVVHHSSCFGCQCQCFHSDGIFPQRCCRPPRLWRSSNRNWLINIAPLQYQKPALSWFASLIFAIWACAIMQRVLMGFFIGSDITSYAENNFMIRCTVLNNLHNRHFPPPPGRPPHTLAQHNRSNVLSNLQ